LIPARDALQRLAAGNRRFVANASSAPRLSPVERARLAQGQEPFAIILGCSDSRVPAELVFDQGFGDLFVIRVAGNVVAPSQIGSVEFAASRFGTRLAVVLGHTQCGAVMATLDEIRQPEMLRSTNLKSIVDRIRPAVEPVLHQFGDRPAMLLQQAVRANIRASVDRLRHGSAILEHLIEAEGLLVTGAEYSLETGVVEFFDSPG
jgi:carbonic anhydrase